MLALTTPKQAMTGPPATRSGSSAGDRPRRVRDHVDVPLVAGGASAVAHVLGVDDQPGRVLEHVPREREVGRAGLPERRDALVHHAVPEEAADDAVLALHQVEVAVAVAARERHPRDEVVEDEVVEDDDARPLAQRVDDPGVGAGVVADVVERDVGLARRPPAAALHDLDVDPLAELRQEQRAVVRDARALRRHRREVGELHESSLPIARSQVTSRAIALPARP